MTIQLLKISRLFVFVWLLFYIDLDAAGFNYRNTIKNHELGLTFASGIDKTYANVFMNLEKYGTTPIFNVKDEKNIYYWLLKRVLLPKYVLFQVTAYPLALVSSYLETFHPPDFNRFNYDDFNILRSIAAGPESPHHFSVLLGNLALFGYRSERRESGYKIIQSGSALAGFLISTGPWHIQDNIRINDRWVHTEIMLTGQIIKARDHKLLWNFRYGLKFHQNSLVQDVATVTLYRTHTEWSYRGFSLLKNSIIQYEAYFPIRKDWKKGRFTVRQLLTLGKKFPLRVLGRYVALKAGGGILWEVLRKYDHKNRRFESYNRPQITWLIQPGIEF